LDINKEQKFSDWYNTITKDAQLCDLRYHVKGFVVFMPWAVMSFKKMYSMYEEELERYEHVPALFPALIPEDYFLTESEHVEGFVPEVFWVTEAAGSTLEPRLAMRPTSETAMYSMYSLWIHGVKDLPLKIYQSCQVWRHETKATKPFIRSREFHWIEAHNCFASEQDALNQVKEDMEMTDRIIHQRFGVPFLFFKRPQWDKFAGAVDTYAADTLMPDGRALQLPSTHNLGQNFSKAFGIKFTDEQGKDDHVWQTCYGPAISRIYAAVIATHGDNKGLILPIDLAPIQVVIVPIYKGENQELVRSECKKVEKLLKKDFKVKFDDSDNTPGFKYNEWEMKGVPIRLEIGPRDIENKSVMLVRRDLKEKKKVKVTDLNKEIPDTGNSILETLIERADSWFSKRMSRAKTLDELKKTIEKGNGFVRVPFCSDELNGKDCADIVKEACAANMRGSLYGSKEKPKGEKCVGCGNDATIYLYAARQY
jgi:prolyl-tRNA synthetase